MITITLTHLLGAAVGVVMITLLVSGALKERGWLE